MRAFISLRVSTQRQADCGVSLGTPEDPGFQESKCRELCAQQGWEVDGVFRDTASGKSDNRDGLAQAVEAACQVKGVVVVYSLSRLGRKMRTLHSLVGELRDCGANIASVSERDLDSTTMSGKVLFAIFALMAEIESDMIAQRTKAGLTESRSKTKCKEWPEGFFPGGPQPYGWAYDTASKRRVALVDEQALIARIRLLHRQKHSNYEIARQLTAEGVPTRKGVQAWSHEMVRRILRRAAC